MMDQNIIKFERKLKDFEQMFEYITPDLDFSKLDQALFPDQDELGWYDEDEEDYAESPNTPDESPNFEELPDRKTTIVTVQDKFGFIQDVVKPDEINNESSIRDQSPVSRSSRNAHYEKRESSMVEDGVRKNSYGIPDKSLKIQFDFKRDAIRKRTLGR